MIFHVYKGNDGDWHWHLKSVGRVIADSSEGYRRRYRAVDMCKRINPNVPVVIDKDSNADNS
jgi:uncharacterized protein YegP (UPF0339 family)